MERLTKKSPEGCWYVPGAPQQLAEGYGGRAVERLAALENVYEGLLQTQQQIAAELQELRAAGKIKTLRFKELMASKLTNQNTISLFESQGL